MGQIIDIEERRKPRHAHSVQPPDHGSGVAFVAPDLTHHLVLPALVLWRSWLAAWSSLWLGPFGLQVSVIEMPKPGEMPKGRAGPRG